MLPATPSFERTALGRVTFGATSQDEAYAQQIGWTAWVEQQLAAPPGDDPHLAAFLATQALTISYAAGADNTNQSWPAVNELRPFDYLNADTTTLWTLQQSNGTAVSPTEVFRVRQELAAGTWIRNTHSQFQLREFMTDFWHNHFNIGKAAHEYATVVLPVYDQSVIRPNVFGNFRQLLGAVATSTAMQGYLDNWLSKAATPNENYARELLELHTLGAGVYQGVVSSAAPNTNSGGYTVTAGFTDGDITEASRALSGWTISNGQWAGEGNVLPNTGVFAYNPVQHNAQMQVFMGAHFAPVIVDRAQGNAVLDIAAYHPATAAFIVGKLCRRIWGDNPPASALQRGQLVWMQNQTAPDQIARVLRTLLDFNSGEVGTGARVKLRRPYEHLIALFRTTGMVVNATTDMTSNLDPVTDGLFAWTPPNGRPDNNAYWLTTGAIVTCWNNAFSWPTRSQINTTLVAQTPSTALTSAISVTEYWVGRMVGFALSTAAMNTLVTDQATSLGVPAVARSTNPNAIETALRRLVALIAQTPEYMYR